MLLSPVEVLLQELGPRLLRASHVGARKVPTRPLATGLREIDALLEGGFPRGGLSEIAGPVSSGRTSLALALLAHTTRAGEVAALVDAADAFDPGSAEAAGVALARVLWARPASPPEAARCSQRLLETHGFALVVLDLAHAGRPGASPRLPRATWQRLARAARATGTALVVLSAAPCTQGCADLALAMQALRAHFAGTPTLLEALEIEAAVARQRAGARRRSASLRLALHLRAA
ncbi:MAG: hypothetical protein OEM49_03550 [Myxococcales bacterium]|nr:hypothetical protein [Myxococcales bacterium]MDH5306222.1 hypothetical protein [Myxococcales bacterium]